MSLRLGVALLTVVASASKVAAADQDSTRATQQLVERLLPDLRFEAVGTDLRRGSGVLTLPVPIVLPCGETDRCADVRFVPELVLEPQLRVANWRWRALVAARGIFLHRDAIPSVAFEGVAVTGADGHGGGVGVSIGLLGALNLSYRSLWTTRGWRHDVGLDLELFSLPMGDHVARVRMPDRSCAYGDSQREPDRPPPPPPCQPRSCEQDACGQQDDGCGGLLECGCAPPLVCERGQCIPATQRRKTPQ